MIETIVSTLVIGVIFLVLVAAFCYILVEVCELLK